MRLIWRQQLQVSLQATVNGNRVNYEIAGNGPWLTLSHPLACNLRLWDAQMPALTPNFRVLRYDTRGHGASAATAGGYPLHQLAADAYELLNSLGVKRTHWVGLSLGSIIGQAFTLEYPDMVQTLTLAGATSRYPAEAGAAFAERIRNVKAGGMEAVIESTLARWFTRSYRETHPQVMEKIAAYIRATPVAGYAGCCHAISRLDLTDRLKQIKCPVLVTVGAQDPSTPVAMARAIYHALPGTELVTVPAAAHLLNLEQMQMFNTALLAFLARTRDAI